MKADLLVAGPHGAQCAGHRHGPPELSPLWKAGGFLVCGDCHTVTHWVWLILSRGASPQDVSVLGAKAGLLIATH